LSLNKELGNKSGEANTLCNIGHIYYKMDNTFKALQYYNDALKIAKKNNYIPIQSKIFKGLSLIYKSQNNPEEEKNFKIKAKRIDEAIKIIKK
jgi:tetratricopeptide (TPR) repeat protein